MVKNGQGKVSFDALFSSFIGTVPNDHYKHQYVERVQNKLLKHMRIHTDPALLRTLLGKELHRYLLYREPDLILEDDRLIISTVHRAKGLEFDTVIVGSCHSNMYPSYQSQLDKSGKKEMEDARILFVALTRAKTKLIIIQPKKYTTARGELRDVRISPFVSPLMSHFDVLRVPQQIPRPDNRSFQVSNDFSCPECGRTWPWDGSRQQDNRCFGCGWVPD